MTENFEEILVLVEKKLDAMRRSLKYCEETVPSTAAMQEIVEKKTRKKFCFISKLLQNYLSIIIFSLQIWTNWRNWEFH